MPEYEHDETLEVDREIKKPPEALFIGLGWDEDSTTKRRHYRRFYNDELENIEEVLPVPTPFNQYDLKRGQTRGASKGIWASITGNYKEDESGQVNTEQIVGRFKAVIEVEIKEEKKEYKKRKIQLV